MDDRTTLPGAPGDEAVLVITPAVAVPAELPARVSEALTCLATIEPIVAAVTERIGTEVMPVARRVWEDGEVPPSVGEEFDALTGWRTLNHALHRLAMALLCAAGESDQPPEADVPAWYPDAVDDPRAADLVRPGG